jgi:hypothetical protein
VAGVEDSLGQLSRVAYSVAGGRTTRVLPTGSGSTRVRFSSCSKVG